MIEKIVQTTMRRKYCMPSLFIYFKCNKVILACIIIQKTDVITSLTIEGTCVYEYLYIIDLIHGQIVYLKLLWYCYEYWTKVVSLVFGNITPG